MWACGNSPGPDSSLFNSNLESKSVPWDAPIKPSHEITKPEGGYGWMVVAASYYAMFTIFGTANSFGMLFAGIREEYGKGQPNIVFKICNYMYLIVTWPSSAMSNNAGYA